MIIDFVSTYTFIKPHIVFSGRNHNKSNAIELLIKIERNEIMEQTKRSSHSGRPSPGHCHLSPQVHGRLHSSSLQITVKHGYFSQTSSQFHSVL